MASRVVRLHACTRTLTRALTIAASGGVLSMATIASAQRSPRASSHVATNDATMLDFVDADIRGVISAIAEVGQINVTFSDLPATKVTLHAHRPDTRDGVMALLKSVTDNNGLKMIDSANVVRIVGPPPIPAAQASTTAVAPGENEPQLFVYRLKHANAPKLATVLRAVFAGGSIPPAKSNIDQQTLSQGLQGQLQPPASGPQPPQAPQISINGQSVEQDPDNPAQGIFQIFGGAQPQQGNRRRNITIVPEESTNSLLVRASASDWVAVKQAIEAVDLRPLQVLIEVVIAEVQRNNNSDLGVKFNASNQRTNADRARSANLPNPTSDSTSDFIASLTRHGRVDVNVAISALQTRGNVRILSRPLVFAENNQQSRLLVGSQRPFIQSFRTLATDNAAQDQIVQYRDVGTKLTILPTINSDGYVNMQVQQEVSSATNEIQFGAPVISTREATASLFVRDGETVVVGGLADSQEQNTRSGIPGLSSIPGIGALFGSTVKRQERTELYLFLTPHVVQSDADAERIREEIRHKSDLLHSVETGSLVTSTIDSAARHGVNPSTPSNPSAPSTPALPPMPAPAPAEPAPTPAPKQ